MKAAKAIQFAAFFAATSLAGCAYHVTMMPRDSGQVLAGELRGAGGQGTMTMNMAGGITCTGPVARVGSTDTFGLVTTYGANTRGGVGTGLGTVHSIGTQYLKAMLTCTDGTGLRCDMSGQGASGGGVCADDRGRVYDFIATVK
ncbi:hypothetical protein JJB11_12135 [Ramlibacter ginsenosidimutans]|uniref:Uncharacterized protein n=1 Tax=Ramlibacter ginsenosidimutans TaxID=502333 RepID=A0A934TT82_9BURK|nr:hypothetical protein [Ramlibacter ginsenosidimutans]MBK6006840.1 hypothetical protein [Ramlibacter ginsenosidimutans]